MSGCRYILGIGHLRWPVAGAEHGHTSFTFLGDAFRARRARGRYGRKLHRVPASD
jgi:hypothetical protein